MHCESTLPTSSCSTVRMLHTIELVATPLFALLRTFTPSLPTSCCHLPGTCPIRQQGTLAMSHEIKSIRILVKEARTWHGEDEEDEYRVRVPLRFDNHPSERHRRMLEDQIAPPRFPPAAPALLSVFTDPTMNGGAAAPAGGRTPGTRARGSDDPADDNDSPDESRSRSKARQSPPTRFR